MTDNMQLQMNEYLPLRDVVFQTLRQAILRGELEPGERLMEIHLANRLGVTLEELFLLAEQGEAGSRDHAPGKGTLCRRPRSRSDR